MEDLNELVVCDIGQERIIGRRQDRCWGKGGSDEAGVIRRAIAIGQTTSDLGCCEIDFVSQVTNPIFIELESAGSKRIGLQHIAADFQETRMDLLDDRGFSQDKIFIATLGGLTTVIFGGGS